MLLEAAVSLDVGGTRGNVDRISGVEKEKEEEEIVSATGGIKQLTI